VDDILKDGGRVPHASQFAAIRTPYEPVGLRNPADELGKTPETPQIWQRRSLLREPHWPDVSGRPA